MITMLLGGLWHGANWTFVAWGAMHGAYLCVTHAWRALRQRTGLPALPRVVAVGVTFACAMIAWVPFRARDMQTAWAMLQGMAGLNGSGWSEWQSRLSPLVVEPTYAPDLSDGGWLALGLAIVFLVPNIYQLAEGRWQLAQAANPGNARMLPWVAFGAGVLFFLALRAMSPVAPSPFLYFQF
jgi:hypothetical protein